MIAVSFVPCAFLLFEACDSGINDGDDIVGILEAFVGSGELVDVVLLNEGFREFLRACGDQ